MAEEIKEAKKSNEKSTIVFVTGWVHKNIIGDYILVSSKLYHDYRNECREERIAARAGHILSVPALIFVHDEWVIGTGDLYKKY